MEAEIRENTTFNQIVRFNVTPNKQATLIDAIAAEIDRWISRCPGFLSATLHASNVGTQVINYAQWETEADFHAFLANPKAQNLQAVIRRVSPDIKPHAVSCRTADRARFPGKTGCGAPVIPMPRY